MKSCANSVSSAVASRFEVSGAEAVERRDRLETAMAKYTPRVIRPLASKVLTFTSGLAATTDDLDSSRSAGELFEVSLLLVTFFVGVALVLKADSVMGCLGGYLLISAMRNTVSGSGHVLSHKCKNKGVQIIYDCVTAIVGLASWEDYKAAHKPHHLHPAEESDPDLMFLTALGLRPTSWSELFRSLLSLRFQMRFLQSRLAAVFLRGPWWRKGLAVLWNCGIVWHFSFLQAVLWYAFVYIGYQMTAAVAWISLHHWWVEKSGSIRARITATEITLGRLNLPDATFAGFFKLLCNGVIGFLLFPGFGEGSHDIHHGSWPESLGMACPYTRTRLILKGIPLRQTASISQMFKAAFAAANGSAEATLAVVENERFLSM